MLLLFWAEDRDLWFLHERIIEISLKYSIFRITTRGYKNSSRGVRLRNMSDHYKLQSVVEGQVVISTHKCLCRLCVYRTV